MPGLIRAVGRTAVVAGTATAVSGHVRRRPEQQYADQDPGQPAPPPPAAPPPGGGVAGEAPPPAAMNAPGAPPDEQFAAAAGKELLGQ